MNVDSVCATIRTELAEAGHVWEEPRPGFFVVTLPGTNKLQTNCSLAVGQHSVSVNAFVARRPDENHLEVYRWLLERNARMFGVTFAVDRLGDLSLIHI